MHLQTYDCVLCDEAVEVTIDHLFLHCEFARLEPSWVKCPPASRPISSSRFFFSRIQQLGVPLYMEIVVILCWSIWTTRNNLIF